MIRISFPGFGIGEFTINKIAFNVFGRDIAWYGILITLGIIGGFLYSAHRAKFEKVKFDDLLDYAIFTVIFALVGARVYFVLFNLNTYDSFWDMISLWNGGLAIYGGLIGGGLAILIVSKIKKINALKALDMISPGVLIGQIIGRFGNFMNGEVYGTTTEIFSRMGIQKAGWSKMYYVHPTFLYEAVWNLLGFLIINALYKKKKFDGQIFIMYFTWYGLGRAYLEGLRTEEYSLYLGVFRISQVVALFTFAIGVILLIAFSIRARNRRIEAEAYTELFGSAPATAEGRSQEPGVGDGDETKQSLQGDPGKPEEHEKPEELEKK